MSEELGSEAHKTRPDLDPEAHSKAEKVKQDLNSIIHLIENNDPTLKTKKIKKKLHHLIETCIAHGILKEDTPKKAIELLAFDIDVDAVLQHLTQDMRDDWFFDVLQHRDLIENKKQLHENLQSLILDGNGKYQGAIRTVYDIPKKSIGLRYSLETDFYDRFIYQAICSFLIPYYDPLLSHRVLGHRYNKNRSSERYIFKSRIDLWTTFEGVTKTSLQNNQTLLVTDLINYFENISIDSIRSAFEESIDKIAATGPKKLMIRNAINTLCELLSRWGFNEKHGLPQNRDASSFIANVVLNSVDQTMVSLKYDYYRYVDDIRIICSSPQAAKIALTELINQLRKIGMNINSAKTNILTSNSATEEISESFPTSDDRSQTIDSMWRSRSRRVIARSAKYIHQLLRECINEKQSQSRQFRFAINRLIQLTEANLFDIHTDIAVELKQLLIKTLEDHAASTDQYCRILWALKPSSDELETISAYLQDHDRSIYSWQNFHLWLLLARAKFKNNEIIGFARKKLTENLLHSECSAIFIYLRCTNETDHLRPLIQEFSNDWPFYHQRNFLLAINEFDKEDVAELLPKIGTKLMWTGLRAKPYFENGIPLLDREPASALSIYEEISPYE
ncbi:RNA-directed DNA polymerase [Pseudomonas tensinigenes]|uniref:RNA-directed DNA polymerase n=1 Tax=Pseudomonas tensinigenes TaxID=2745511 RepID=A0ABX8PR12_9PSED|nr:RNA-directed DNA polymerase [Pseudomonas tensinigenes]QXI03743.1 RNA-directed DNA polymerase [Pseudomonas tensinigenes]